METTTQQLADMLRESKMLTDSGLSRLLNGDTLSFNLASLAEVVNFCAPRTSIGSHRQNLLTQSKDWGRERDRLTDDLAEARTLIATLRGVITEHVQQAENLEKQAYSDKLMRDRLLTALKVARQGLDQVGIIDALVDHGRNAVTIVHVEAALAAAGVML